MIRLITLIIAILFIKPDSYSQNKKAIASPQQKGKVGPLKKSNYDYYVVLPLGSGGGVPSASNQAYNPAYRIIDIRSGDVVTNGWPSGDNYISDNYQKLLNTNGRWPLYTASAFLFDTTGLFQRRIDPQSVMAGNLYNGNFSPDFRNMLFQKEDDLWTCDINIITGKVGAPRQLTRFGFQENQQQIWGWYKDGVAFGQKYWINLKTGDVEDIANHNPSALWMPDARKISENPFHRFSIDRQLFISNLAIRDQNIGTDILDISSNKLIKIIPAYRADLLTIYSYWLKNRQLVTYNELTKQGGIFSVGYDNKISYKKIPVGKFPDEKFEDLETIKTVSEILIPQTSQFGRACFSPDTTKFLYYHSNGISRTIYKRLDLLPEWFIYEPVTGKSQSVGLDWQYVCWIDNEHLICSRNGSTNEQGTYIYDINTKTSKKLFSYVIENARGIGQERTLYHQKSNYLLFGSHRSIWRCRPDGSELIELVKGVEENVTMKPFISGIIN